jgi:hypothetical protein
MSDSHKTAGAMKKVKEYANSVLYPVSSSVPKFADRYFCQVSAIA